ncbi:MAG: electron transfer flavoprotein subunit alpha, partial [Algoriphagus sp. 32-45-6]
MSILVYIEQAEGKVKKTSLEAVSFAAALTAQTGEGEVVALALGAVEHDELTAIGKAGASKVLHAADERLNAGVIQAHAAVVAQAFSTVGAKTLVLAKSSL